MQLTDDDVRAFQVAWQQDFGESITAEQARRQAHLLVELYAVLDARPRQEQGKPERNH